MYRILAPLAIVFANAAIILCSPGGSGARSGIGEEISSMEHTRAILEGRDLEMVHDGDIIVVDDDDDDDAVAGKPFANLSFYSFQNVSFKFESHKKDSELK